MTLFEKLHESVNLGYFIAFGRDINQLVVRVNYQDKDGNLLQRQTLLPLQDHFYEKKVIDCIEWSIYEIQKELT